MIPVNSPSISGFSFRVYDSYDDAQADQWWRDIDKRAADADSVFDLNEVLQPLLMAMFLDLAGDEARDIMRPISFMLPMIFMNRAFMLGVLHVAAHMGVTPAELVECCDEEKPTARTHKAMLALMRKKLRTGVVR